MHRHLFRAQLGMLALAVILPVAVLADGFWLRLIAAGALFTSGLATGYQLVRHAQAVSRKMTNVPPYVMMAPQGSPLPAINDKDYQ
ncbi:hypothetical protein [Pseudomonas putida]|uniref:Nitric oxide dioxygenase n=1 Tax=Pseudomonas putida TaxID=303 RepID=A0A1L7NPX5_PSEPU|nr:hypothetical protein [Pseudomonas putida]BAW27535.1 Nitric oxide dioxygenase [Pseudomonas putida]